LFDFRRELKKSPFSCSRSNSRNQRVGAAILFFFSCISGLQLRFDSILTVRFFFPIHEAALADGDAAYSSLDSDDEYEKFIQKMNPPR